MQYRKDRKSPWMVQVRDRQGKLKTASFATKEAAERFEIAEKEKRRLMRRGLSAPREQILFMDYAAIWIQKRMAKMAFSTVSQDERRLRQYWVPKVGDIPLEYLKTEDILNELDRIQFELKHSSADRNRHRALLHKLFRDAMMEGRVDFNPVSRIPLEDEETEDRKLRRPRRKLNDQEQNLYVQGMYKEGPQYGILADLLLWTGARVCSANVIQYQDIDFERGILRIRRIEERASGEIRERQKGRKRSQKGDHKVPLFPRLRDALLTHMRTSPYTKPTDFIACRSDGGFIPYDTLKDVHARVIKAGGITRITFHDLRRTFATNCKKKGYTRTEIKELLDHSTELLGDLYDLDDIEHLVEKGKRLGFGEREKRTNVVSLRG